MLTWPPCPRAGPAASAYCLCARGGCNQHDQLAQELRLLPGACCCGTCSPPDKGSWPPLPHLYFSSSASVLGVVSAALEVNFRVNHRTLCSSFWLNAGWKDAASSPAALWFVVCDNSDWLQMLPTSLVQMHCLKTLISVSLGVVSPLVQLVPWYLIIR